MLTMRYRKAVTTEVQDRYKKSTKKKKGTILNEFIATTGYNRTYAARILSLAEGKVIGYSRSGGKRLAPFMKEALEKLERHREINLDPTVREKLSKVSASTIDRLLKPERDRFRLGKGRSGTKPGSLLKKAIPIRTFADFR